jgi:mono/diheme cytochrome c family protein
VILAGRKRIVVAAASGVVLLAVAGLAFLLWPGREPTARIDPNDETAVALGERLYAANCASCHGVALEGQPNWRERLPNGRLPAPPHDESGHTWHHPDTQLFALTKYGPSALIQGGYESDMPAFAGRLTDAEILAVLAYIKSTWPTAVRRQHDLINARNE